MSARKAKRQPKAQGVTRRILQLVNRIRDAKKPPKNLAAYAEIAEHFAVPLWVMFVPNLRQGMLQEPQLTRFVEHVESYLASAEAVAEPPAHVPECERQTEFRLDEPDLPIAGLPAPLPCPFCGVVSNVVVIEGPDEHNTRHAHVECTNCGAEAPGHSAASEGDDPTSYGVAKEAARLWNERKGGAK